MNCTEQLTADDIQTIAEQTRQEHVRANDLDVWPDCYEISRLIKERLKEGFTVSEDEVEIVQYNIQHHGSKTFAHYVLVIDATVTGNTLLVDASFDQFANETETPINITSKQEIQPVIVTEKHAYVFNQSETI